MAKQILKFNNKEYSIDSSVLADATATLEAHLMGMMEERLEGDGAEYYTLAPTALSFRSTAPLNELQEVQINGVTVDPSNYTLEEGSTIVTFPIDYLKTLDVGNYEVAVASDSKTVKGDFSVKAPELNEHGFYYNQPYTAYVPYYGEKVAFIFRKDGSGDFLLLSSGYTETVSFISSANTIVLNGVAGTFNATVSSDGIEVYCIELDTTFKLGDETIAADEDYVYVYYDEIKGYVIYPIEKNKSYYAAAKTGVNEMPTLGFYAQSFKNNTYLVESPKIPDTTLVIGDQVFYGCTKLSKIIIPESVIRIANEAFSGCSQLTSIAFDGTINQWNAISKGENWNYNVPATYVQCSDGQVAL